MKNLMILTSIVFSFNVLASSLDQKLESYIKDFNLKPISSPGPVNKDLFSLGRDLYFEENISGNNNISCASCHHPMTRTQDGLPLGLGEGSDGIEIQRGGRKQLTGTLLARNTPAVFNLHNVPVMFWDGRVEFNAASGRFTTPGPLSKEVALVLDNALSAQALFPMINHAEMRGKPGTNEIADAKTDQEAWDAILARVMKTPNYQSRLEKIFPGEKINIGHVAKAIGHFEAQAFYAGDTAYDRYLRGDKNAMSEIQKIGMDVFFGKGKCGECHKGEHLSDFSYQNIGIPQIGPGKVDGDDYGRMEWEPKESNLYAFRVPPLRNVALTAPYMHNGAFKTIAQVVEHYDDIEASLNEYVFVNNYKNYVELISGPLKQTNENKLAHLSLKLSKRLFFEESEEKALAEFLKGALTEKKFLDAEIDADYVSTMRIQLSEDGFNKIINNLPKDVLVKDTTYLYFDVLNSEGYALRELERPIKIYFTQSNGEMKLTYRKQLYKTSGSVDGLIAAGTFEDEEILVIDPALSSQMSSLNKDFFERLYTYNNESGGQPIPTVETTVMKNNVLAMNDLWHTLKLKHLENISDELNIPQENLFFAPTSSNSKVEYSWIQMIEGSAVEVLLQRSIIRNEVGGIVTTWAIEAKLNKFTKAEITFKLNSWLKNLVGIGLVPKDAQGTSPSPSKLTESVLKEILK
ncbi:MAG: cytochrome-c peroxidase [Bacteriovoracaceae bacterium]